MLILSFLTISYDRLSRLDGGAGILGTLTFTKAVYHKSCSLKFSTSKLIKKRKSIEKGCNVMKRTRTSLNAEHNIAVCFFCIGVLRVCQMGALHPPVVLHPSFIFAPRCRFGYKKMSL